ncbi:hypothetical protein EGR_07623 [Echinococcus granulosus]|uniref:Uncharacterized protein n=1 Tax=Echinococcus granulosus TaxID=6210 RepID=W6UHI0_ECHGR|nr:hypothetical protein EGR_07623 [Echinococcus granulosus]EUB57532.1 hypothetical protein EGR_07623 [Echinococcus granulosus]
MDYDGCYLSKIIRLIVKSDRYNLSEIALTLRLNKHAEKEILHTTGFGFFAFLKRMHVAAPKFAYYTFVCFNDASLFPVLLLLLQHTLVVPNQGISIVKKTFSKITTSCILLTVLGSQSPIQRSPAPNIWFKSYPTQCFVILVKQGITAEMLEGAKGSYICLALKSHTHECFWRKMRLMRGVK